MTPAEEQGPKEPSKRAVFLGQLTMARWRQSEGLAKHYQGGSKSLARFQESALSICFTWATNTRWRLFLSFSVSGDQTPQGSERAARGKKRRQGKRGTAMPAKLKPAQKA